MNIINSFFLFFSLLPQLSIARMDPLSQVFSLRWNQHQSNMLSVFDKLLQSEAFCDVTLACDGGSLKCHKIVLAASSDYFQKLFMENNSEHPIVFLKVRLIIFSEIFLIKIISGCESCASSCHSRLYVQR